jgi:hypothetical protein
MRREVEGEPVVCQGDVAARERMRVMPPSLEWDE